MIIRSDEFTDLPTAFGPMRTFVHRPVAPGRYPGILLFSEIFQVTGPIRRTAALLAGHGFVVAVPEIYHEYLPAGTALAYDQEGADEGNRLKTTKKLESYDADSRAVLDFLAAHPACTGALGVVGICIGGHLSFRAAAKNKDVRAAACYYATDIHKQGLGEGANDDTLVSIAGTNAELLLIWGRQDPHIPLEGRRKVQAHLDEVDATYSWHELNGQHAFIRDEGPRYDAELAQLVYSLTLSLFHRRLHEGGRPEEADTRPKETRH